MTIPTLSPGFSFYNVDTKAGEYVGLNKQNQFIVVMPKEPGRFARFKAALTSAGPPSASLSSSAASQKPDQIARNALTSAGTPSARLSSSAASQKPDQIETPEQIRNEGYNSTLLKAVRSYASCQTAAAHFAFHGLIAKLGEREVLRLPPSGFSALVCNYMSTHQDKLARVTGQEAVKVAVTVELRNRSKDLDARASAMPGYTLASHAVFVGMLKTAVTRSAMTIIQQDRANLARDYAAERAKQQDSKSATLPADQKASLRSHGITIDDLERDAAKLDDRSSVNVVIRNVEGYVEQALALYPAKAVAATAPSRSERALRRQHEAQIVQLQTRITDAKIPGELRPSRLEVLKLSCATPQFSAQYDELSAMVTRLEAASTSEREEVAAAVRDGLGLLATVPDLYSVSGQEAFDQSEFLIKLAPVRERFRLDEKALNLTLLLFSKASPQTRADVATRALEIFWSSTTKIGDATHLYWAGVIHLALAELAPTS